MDDFDGEDGIYIDDDAVPNPNETIRYHNNHQVIFNNLGYSSSSSSADSSDSEPNDSSSLTSLRATFRLHLALISPASLPERGLIWTCPVPLVLPGPSSERKPCPYKIDFSSITSQDLTSRGIPAPLARWVANRLWGDTGGIRGDARVGEVFGMLWARHRTEHLLDAGVRRGKDGVSSSSSDLNAFGTDYGCSARVGSGESCDGWSAAFK